MSKIFSLWQNEMLKTFRKVSTIILLIAIFAAPFATGGMMKLAAVSFGYNSNYQVDADKQIASVQSEINDKEAEINNSADAAGLQAQNTNLASLYSQLYSLELNKQYNISDADSSNYRYSLTNELANIKAQLKVPSVAFYSESSDDASGNSYDGYTQDKAAVVAGEAPDAAKITELEALAKRFESILDNKDYADYCTYKKETIDKSTVYSDGEKAARKKSYDLYLAADPQGINNASELPNAISSIEHYSIMLSEGIYVDDNGNQRPMSVDQENELKNNLAVNEYKVRNGVVKTTAVSNEAISEMADFCNTACMQVSGTLLTLMVLIIAGGCISQEISSGSIKSLIISPTRRWKIFTAKFLSIISVMIIGLAAEYAGTVLAGSLFFGSEAFPAYISAVGGVASATNGYVFVLLEGLVTLIPLLIIAAFAMMLSTCTRNTAASVGIAMAVYFIGSTVMQIVKLMGINGEWVKFIPFTNMDQLSQQFFPFSNVTQMVSGMGLEVSLPSLLFSLCYLGVLFICLIYTAFDSFTRSDI